MSKKLAIIGSGRMAWIISRNAHEMGITTYCFSNAMPDYIRDEVDHFYDISIFEKDAIVEICQKENIKGVIATTELTIPIAAYVAEKLSTPGLAYKTALKITDKYRNRQLCGSIAGIASIRSRRILADDLPKFDSIDFPVIIKPVNQGGKRGVVVVDRYEDFPSAYEYAKANSKGEGVVIEDYIRYGKEYSVETLSYEGRHYVIQVTEKISSGPPHCVELGHHQPAALSPEMSELINEVIPKCLSAIGVDNTSAHTEIKISEGKLYIIEFNIRPGGDHIAWPLTELSTGYNYIKGAIEISMGEFLGVDVGKFTHHYAGVYFVAQQTSWLKPIFDECEQYEWLYHKNLVSNELLPLEHNDCYGTNSMIYFSKDRRINLQPQNFDHGRDKVC